MNKVIYRNLRKEDYFEIENLIANSFNLKNYLPNERTLTEMKHSYLQSCLAEQTYCCVAEIDGIVVGVIMGNSKKQYRLLNHFRPCISSFYHSLAMNVIARKNGCSLNDYHNLHKTYAKLIKNRINKYDGVLTLFAVNENYRGYGIGTQLLKNVEGYFNKNNVEHIYLFTDSLCNTQFYDNHNFMRVKNMKIEMKSVSHKIMLDVYLYEKHYSLTKK